MNKKFHELYWEFFFLFYEWFIKAKNSLNGICTGLHLIGMGTENCVKDIVFDEVFLPFSLIIMHMILPQSFSLPVNQAILKLLE